MQELRIGNKVAQVPIIQGGMGVGISRSSLAGAVAKEGGIGVISTAQIGYDEPEFEQNPSECNLKAIHKHIRRAKEISGGKGLVGVNVMRALKDYKEHVRQAVYSGADVIICGAGIPTDLPGILQECKEKVSELPAIAPIVSSERAIELIFRMWEKKYHTTADFLVVEGPKAGGHLGFSKEVLQQMTSERFEQEIQKIIMCVRQYEGRFAKKIPIIVAGGIYDKKDIARMISLGADGVQIASRFVATYECDAAQAYKEAYVHAHSEDIEIIDSPVGMPGRALKNAFTEKIARHREKISKCYGCLEKCNPAKVPYCITQALVRAVQGDVENGLIFCGENVGRMNRIYSVQELMAELTR